MSKRSRTYARFPGKPAVLAALKAAGGWSPADAFNFARSNGGSADTYAALRHYVERGKLAHSTTPERWEFVSRYCPAESQVLCSPD